jgi:hypothetical protein
MFEATQRRLEPLAARAVAFHTTTYQSGGVRLLVMGLG